MGFTTFEITLRVFVIFGFLVVDRLCYKRKKSGKSCRTLRVFLIFRYLVVGRLFQEKKSENPVDDNYYHFPQRLNVSSVARYFSEVL